MLRKSDNFAFNSVPFILPIWFVTLINAMWLYSTYILHSPCSRQISPKTLVQPQRLALSLVHTSRVAWKQVAWIQAYVHI
jgi:hypothetical protein